MFARISRFVAYSLLAVLFSLGAPPVASAADVTVFAAASLKNALEDIRHAFEAETGYSVALSLAGSSLLARQITLGAPADIFIPANPDWLDYVEAQDRLVAGSRQDLLAITLVLIAPKRSARSITGFDDPVLFEQLAQGRLAMALTEAVPAGIYGKQAMQSLGLWSQVSPQIAQTDNVRAALALVAVGEAPLGIVYASDAKAEPRVTVLARFPASSHAPIIYPMARILPADRPAVVAFQTYLQSPSAQRSFHTMGFRAIAE